VRLIVHENWRFQAWYRETRRLIDAGAFGRVFHAGFRLRAGDGRGPEPYTVQPYFREMPRLLIYETLVHFLDIFRYLAGEIESVYCVTRRVNPAIRGEDYAVVETRFAGGAHGLIDANRISGPSPPSPTFGELFVEGDLGCLRMTPEGDLFTARYGEPEQPHRYDKPSAGYRGDSVRAFQQHAAECLRSGEPAESEGRAYLATVAAVEACYRSAASGKVEAVR
jgi:predicted dehydrogenase